MQTLCKERGLVSDLRCRLSETMADPQTREVKEDHECYTLAQLAPKGLLFEVSLRPESVRIGCHHTPRAVHYDTLFGSHHANFQRSCPSVRVLVRRSSHCLAQQPSMNQHSLFLFLKGAVLHADSDVRRVQLKILYFCHQQSKSVRWCRMLMIAHPRAQAIVKGDLRPC